MTHRNESHQTTLVWEGKGCTFAIKPHLNEHGYNELPECRQSADHLDISGITIASWEGDEVQTSRPKIFRTTLRLDNAQQSGSDRA